MNRKQNFYIGITLILFVFLMNFKANIFAATPQKRSVTVTVKLAEKYRSQVNAQDIVFIFARAVRGPRVPLAVVRVQVSDLPLRLTLDDSMAMAPMFRLSSFQHVRVNARVSKSGRPMATPGDLQGISQVVDLDQNKPFLSIVIDQQVQ